MNFFVLPPHAKEGPYLKKRSQAENPSAQSDIPLLDIRYNLRTSWEALCLLYLSLHFNYWETETIVRSISQRAYQFSYEGEWTTVQQFLEAQLHTPQQFESFWKDSGRPTEEFYGNLVPFAAKLEKRLNYRDTTLQRTGKVRRPQRKRGYADKGSRRLPHERHGDPPVREKVDRRKLILFHPLLLDQFTSEGEIASTHIPYREEGFE